MMAMEQSRPCSDNFRVIVLTRKSRLSYHDSKKTIDYAMVLINLNVLSSTGDSVTQINQLLAHDGELNKYRPMKTLTLRSLSRW